MLGTITYAAVVTAALGLALFWLSRRRVSAWLGWPLGLAFCWAVELWQLMGVPARLSSQWVGWRLTLGTTFDWRDVALYPVGVLVAAATLWSVRALRAARTDRSRETVRQLLSGTSIVTFWCSLLAWFWWQSRAWHAFWGQPGVFDEDSGTVVSEVAAQMEALMHQAQLISAGCGVLCLAAVVLFLATRPARPENTGHSLGAREALLRGMDALAAVLATGLVFLSAWGWWGFWVPVLGCIAHATLVARVGSAGRLPGRRAWWRGVAAVARTALVLVLVAFVGIGAAGLLTWLNNSTHGAVEWLVIPAQWGITVAVAALAGYWLAKWTQSQAANEQDLAIASNGQPHPTMAPELKPTPHSSPAPAVELTSTARPVTREITVGVFGLLLPLAVCSALLATQGAGDAIAAARTFDRLDQVAILPPVYPGEPLQPSSPATTPAAPPAISSPSASSPAPSATAIVPPAPAPTPTPPTAGTVVTARHACAADQLRFELVGAEPQLPGNGYGALQAINMGPDACWLRGRPVLSLAQGGRLLEITSGTPEVLVPAGENLRVGLAPGQRAEALLGWRGYRNADHERDQHQTLMVALTAKQPAVPAVTAIRVNDGYTSSPEESNHPFDLVKGGHLGVGTWAVPGTGGY